MMLLLISLFGGNAFFFFFFLIKKISNFLKIFFINETGECLGLSSFNTDRRTCSCAD